jgi:hypothetical protein
MDCRVGRIVEHLAGGIADGLHRNLIWLQGDTGAYARHLRFHHNSSRQWR